MQQLTIEHKKVKANNSRTVSKSEEIVEIENKREGHGRNIALTRNVFYLGNSKDIYYVQSERSDNAYYFVKYMCGVNEDWCSCLDNSMRKIKCKHIFAIEYNIRKNTLQEIEKLPPNAIRYPQKITTKNWRNDDYDF